MKKVLTMTMNPCIDRTIYFSKFTQGATNYVDNVMEEAAGKGINVAVALSHVQIPVKALGFAYTDNASNLYDKLEKEQIPHAFVELPGKMRVNQKLFDKSTREMTECNERGQEVGSEAVEKLVSWLEEELKDASILVLCGSVPPGVPADIYGQMIRLAKTAGVLTVLDATGKLLEEGVKEKPYLIKPNWEEFVATFLEADLDKAEQKRNKSERQAEQIAPKSERQAEQKSRESEKQAEQKSRESERQAEQKSRESEKRVEQKATELVQMGIQNVCISMGKEGMLLVNKKGLQKYPAKEADVKSLQGAGDAMVAGLCKAIHEKQEEKMAEYALQLAASTISLEGTQMGYL